MRGDDLIAYAEGPSTERIMALHQERLRAGEDRDRRAAAAPRRPRSRPYAVRLLGTALIALGRSLEGSDLRERARLHGGDGRRREPSCSPP